MSGLVRSRSAGPGLEFRPSRREGGAATYAIKQVAPVIKEELREIVVITVYTFYFRSAVIMKISYDSEIDALYIGPDALKPLKTRLHHQELKERGAV